MVWLNATEFLRHVDAHGALRLRPDQVRSANARDTVDLDTPAAAATSPMVT